MDRARVEPTPLVADGDLDKRRAALRAALLVQQLRPEQPESGTLTAHALSPAQRAQLREQLRQQGR